MRACASDLAPPPPPPPPPSENPGSAPGVNDRSGGSDREEGVLKTAVHEYFTHEQGHGDGKDTGNQR